MKLSVPGSFSVGVPVKESVKRSKTGRALAMAQPHSRTDSFNFNRATRFAGALDHKDTIRKSPFVGLGDRHVFSPLRGLTEADSLSMLFLNYLTLQDYAKSAKGDDSHLTFFANDAAPASRLHGENAFADAMLLLNRPVDVVVNEITSTLGVRVLQAATGKRLAYANAGFVLGPVQARDMGPVQDANNRLRFDNENNQALVSHIIARAGVKDEEGGLSARKKVWDDLSYGTPLTAIGALGYGTLGLVDAILVNVKVAGEKLKQERVLTREDLDAYLQKHPSLNSSDKLKMFFRNNANLDKVVEWKMKNGGLKTLKEFSPGSVSSEEQQIYRSAIETLVEAQQAQMSAMPNVPNPDDIMNDNSFASLMEQASQKAAEKKAEMDMEHFKAMHEFSIYQHVSGIFNGFLHGLKTGLSENMFAMMTPKLEGHPMKAELVQNVNLKAPTGPYRLEMLNVPGGRSGNGVSLIKRDAILFPGGFTQKSGEQMVRALLEIGDKKRMFATSEDTKNLPLDTNTLIVENSPGGMVWSLMDMKNAIEEHPVDVDILVTGIGASCGGILSQLATGNRFITPNASLLLHTVRSERDRGNSAEANGTGLSKNQMQDVVDKAMADRAGLTLKQIRDLQAHDFWPNAVEALVVGTKGLVDAIVTGPTHGLLREDVMDFITEVKGSPEAARRYINQHIEERSQGDSQALPQDHKGLMEDPLSNPVELVAELKRRGKERDLTQMPKFEKSFAPDMPQTLKTVDTFALLNPENQSLSLDDLSAQG